MTRAQGLLVALAGLLSAGASGCGKDVVLGDGLSLQDRAVDGGSEPDDDAHPVPRFSEPVAIGALAADEGEDDDPALNRELTWIFFNSTRDGGLGGEDIWFSQRASPSDPWGTPQPAVALNTEGRETGMALSADGLTVYWSSDREGGEGGLDIYVATRATSSDPWSAPQAVEELNTPGDDLVSAVVDEGRRVLFARRQGDEGYDLWWARRTRFWWVLVGRLLFTRSDDLQVAVRPGDEAPFGDEQLLSTLNSDEADTDAWSDDDMSYLVFASARSGASRLYEATRLSDP